MGREFESSELQEQQEEPEGVSASGRKPFEFENCPKVGHYYYY